MAESGDSRLFHAEGPLVIGKAQDASATEARPAVLHIGMPENMITWALTSDLPTLKVQRTAFMAAVPYSQRFYIIDFLPGAQLQCVSSPCLTTTLPDSLSGMLLQHALDTSWHAAAMIACCPTAMWQLHQRSHCLHDTANFGKPSSDRHTWSCRDAR